MVLAYPDFYGVRILCLSCLCDNLAASVGVVESGLWTVDVLKALLLAMEQRIGLVWFGLVWFGLVWFGLVWFGLVWFGLVWFGLVWFGLVGLVATTRQLALLDDETELFRKKPWWEP